MRFKQGKGDLAGFKEFMTIPGRSPTSYVLKRKEVKQSSRKH